MITSSVMENWYIYKGYLTSIRLRKVIIASLYAKVSKFSMKSIIETNSGKLITIISGDYQSIERLMGMISMGFVSPFINLAAYAVIGVTSGWEYALITFTIWIIILIC